MVEDDQKEKKCPITPTNGEAATAIDTPVHTNITRKRRPSKAGTSTPEDARRGMLYLRGEDKYSPLEGMRELPDVMNTGQIITHEEIFQVRADEEDERHIGELVRILKQRGNLDPILVKALGRNQTVVIDGHHRLLAYETARINPVPVEWFHGSIIDALKMAFSGNNKISLNLTGRQRSNAAWRLVCMTEAEFSKREISSNSKEKGRQIK